MARTVRELSTEIEHENTPAPRRREPATPLPRFRRIYGRSRMCQRAGVYTLRMAESSTTPRAERLLAIIELQNAIAAAGMNSDDVMRIVADRAFGLAGGSGAVALLVEGDDVVCRAAAGTSKQVLGLRQSPSTAPGRCVAERKPLRDPDGAALYVPVLHGEYAVGVLGVASASRAAFSDEDINTLEILAGIIAIALHRTRAFPRARPDNLHDTLTGLLNRRAFSERVTVELARRSRYDQSFSIAMLDLDGFNTANDRFGEAAGDELLRSIATILNTHTRVMDACFRLGGDEFAIVMPGTALEGARILAERCRTYIAEAGLCEGTVTASFGVVEAVDETLEILTERVDAALRVDKQAHQK
jgi:diguanylate cyclase (GGDEF)-like protein